MNLRAAWIAYRTIVIREVLRFARIWVQTIVPPAVTTALYFVIFGHLIGSQLDDMQGYAYVDYIVPGLIMMSVITQSYANVVSSFFGTKYHRNIEEMLTSPMSSVVIVAGFVTGGVARGMAVGGVVSLVAYAFAEPRIAHPGVALGIALLTAVVFALGGLINAIYAKTFDDISIVPTFVLTPLTYLGGVFYTIDLLPDFWQQVSLVNPILYMINAFRYGLLGVTDIRLGLAFLITLLFALALFLIAVRMIQKGVGIKH
ncbi:MAG: ABC transporter permease [Chromatiales bacterium]|nr:ABC transporter permease [Chromatiales bacterium]